MAWVKTAQFDRWRSLPLGNRNRIETKLIILLYRIQVTCLLIYSLNFELSQNGFVQGGPGLEGGGRGDDITPRGGAGAGLECC